MTHRWIIDPDLPTGFREQEYKVRIAWAQSMTPEERVLEGLRMFDTERRLMTSKIRLEFPTADESLVRKILHDRLEEFREEEKAVWSGYKPVRLPPP